MATLLRTAVTRCPQFSTQQAQRDHESVPPRQCVTWLCASSHGAQIVFKMRPDGIGLRYSKDLMLRWLDDNAPLNEAGLYWDESRLRQVRRGLGLQKQSCC